LVVTILFLAVTVFLPAGDIGWWQGWLFVLVFLALVIASVAYLWFANPEIFVAKNIGTS
jgi:ABC-type multidrug transport system permease subunit